MKKPDDKPATLEERLIGAFISAVAMTCTIAVFSFVIFVISSRGRFAGMDMFFHFVFSKVSLFIIAGTAVLGFSLSFDRMLDLFGTLWGTNPASGTDSTGKSVILAAFALAFVAAVLLLRR